MYMPAACQYSISCNYLCLQRDHEHCTRIKQDIEMVLSLTSTKLNDIRTCYVILHYASYENMITTPPPMKDETRRSPSAEECAGKV